jgi:hypothetical protein
MIGRGMALVVAGSLLPASAWADTQSNDGSGLQTHRSEVACENTSNPSLRPAPPSVGVALTNAVVRSANEMASDSRECAFANAVAERNVSLMIELGGTVKEVAAVALGGEQRVADRGYDLSTAQYIQTSDGRVAVAVLGPYGRVSYLIPGYLPEDGVNSLPTLSEVNRNDPPVTSRPDDPNMPAPAPLNISLSKQ